MKCPPGQAPGECTSTSHANAIETKVQFPERRVYPSDDAPKVCSSLRFISRVSTSRLGFTLTSVTRRLARGTDTFTAGSLL